MVSTTAEMKGARLAVPKAGQTAAMSGGNWAVKRAWMKAGCLDFRMAVTKAGELGVQRAGCWDELTADQKEHR